MNIFYWLNFFRILYFWTLLELKTKLSNFVLGLHRCSIHFIGLNYCRHQLDRLFAKQRMLPSCKIKFMWNNALFGSVMKFVYWETRSETCGSASPTVTHNRYRSTSITLCVTVFRSHRRTNFAVCSLPSSVNIRDNHWVTIRLRWKTTHPRFKQKLFNLDNYT